MLEKNQIYSELGRDVWNYSKSNIKKIATSLFGCVVSVTNDFLEFNELNELLYRMDKKSFSRFQQPIIGDMHFLSPGTSYVIFKKTFIIKVTTDMLNEGREKLTCEIFGPDAKKIQRYLLKKISNTWSNNDGHITVQMRRGLYNQTVCNEFKNIVLTPENQRKIIKGLYDWKHNKSYYEDHHITYKLGILLYGKPGTGKSSIIRAIATTLNAPVYNFDTFDAIDSYYGISELHRINKNRPIVVILEDVDFAFGKRNSIKDQSRDFFEARHKSSMENKNQQILFQILDGLFSLDNVIYVATTNHIENLDEGFTRPGRFDIQIELDYFSKEQAEYFWKSVCNLDLKYLEKLNLEYPIQPALLQGYALQFVNTGNLNQNPSIQHSQKDHARKHVYQGPYPRSVKVKDVSAIAGMFEAHNRIRSEYLKRAEKLTKDLNDAVGVISPLTFDIVEEG